MIVSRYRGYGGHEIVINNISKGLIKLGYNVTIGAMAFDQNPPSDIDVVRIKRFGYWDWLNDKSFDLYHSHQTHTNYYSIFGKKPFVFHFHGASNTIQELNLKLCMSLCKHKISRIMCVSNSSLEQFYNITNCESEVLYNGVDTDLLNPSLPRPYSKGDPQLLFVGKLYHHKNVRTLVLGMPSVLSQYPNAHFQIVGSGEDYQSIAALIREHKLQANVELCGSCSEDELKHRISSCDIYISASEWEMFDLPALEAMACGKPVLLSNIPAHRELIEGSGAGLIFNEVNEIPRKIAEIHANSQAMGNNGRIFAEKRDWRVASKNMSKIYDNLLNKR